MKTMIDTKHVGNIKSLRHVMTKSQGGSINLPYLNLYVQQINRYKLDREKRAIINRLEEINKQIRDIDEQTKSLRPQIISCLDRGSEGNRRKAKKSRTSEGNGRGRVVRKLKVNY